MIVLLKTSVRSKTSLYVRAVLWTFEQLLASNKQYINKIPFMIVYCNFPNTTKTSHAIKHPIIYTDSSPMVAAQISLALFFV